MFTIGCPQSIYANSIRPVARSVIYYLFICFLVTYISYNQNCDQSCLSRIFFRFCWNDFYRLVHAKYNLPDWQAVNLTVFSPCWTKQTFYLGECCLLCLVVILRHFLALFLSEQSRGQCFWTDQKITFKNPITCNINIAFWKTGLN